MFAGYHAGIRAGQGVCCVVNGVHSMDHPYHLERSCCPGLRGSVRGSKGRGWQRVGAYDEGGMWATRHETRWFVGGKGVLRGGGGRAHVSVPLVSMLEVCSTGAWSIGSGGGDAVGEGLPGAASGSRQSEEEGWGSFTLRCATAIAVYSRHTTYQKQGAALSLF